MDCGFRTRSASASRLKKHAYFVQPEVVSDFPGLRAGAGEDGGIPEIE